MSKHWNQLPLLVRLVAERCAKPGETHATLAQEMGYAQSYLESVLYDQRAPGFKFKARCAEVFQRDVNDFLDNPGAPRPTSMDLSKFSNIDIYHFDELVRGIDDQRLTKDEQAILFKALSKFLDDQKQLILNVKNSKK